jgi:hypothetical protein
MSYGSALRQRFEGLLLGTAGTTRTMTAGRFHLEAPDAATALDQPSHSAERAVRVTLDPGDDLDPVNPLDNQVYRTHRLVVRVGYLLTNAGGDLAEVVGEQSGAATVDAIRDRALADQHAIEAVFTWYENRAGVDPDILNVTRLPGAALAREADDRLTLTLPFAVDVLATVPGSYAT